MTPLSHNPGRLTASRGFTLVELLFVIAGIVVLLAILLPSIAMIRGQAKSVQCKVQMRQLYQAAAMEFTMMNNNELPMPTDFIETANNAAAMRTGVWAMQKKGVANLNAGALWKYLSADIEIRRKLIWCPADQGEFYKSGAKIDRNVSYSFNDEVRLTPRTAYRSRFLREIEKPAEKIYIVEEIGPNDARCIRPWNNDEDYISGRHGKIGSLKYDSEEYRTAGRSNVVFFDGRVEEVIPREFYQNASRFTLP